MVVVVVVVVAAAVDDDDMDIHTTKEVVEGRDMEHTSALELALDTVCPSFEAFASVVAVAGVVVEEHRAYDERKCWTIHLDSELLTLYDVFLLLLLLLLLQSNPVVQID